MKSRSLCLTFALVLGFSAVADAGKKNNTGLVAYCLSNGSSKTVHLVMYYGKQKTKVLTDIHIERRALGSVDSKKSNTGSTAVTFSLVGGPGGKDIEFDVYDDSGKKLGSKGFFVEPNTPPNGSQGTTVDPKDEIVNIGVSPSNEVYFSVNAKP